MLVRPPSDPQVEQGCPPQIVKVEREVFEFDIDQLIGSQIAAESTCNVIHPEEMEAAVKQGLLLLLVLVLWASRKGRI